MNPSRVISLSALLLLSLSLSSCKEKPLAVEKTVTGSRIDILDGVIENRSLDFHFKEPEKKHTSRDLFNFIYFEGDTICFSYSLTRRLYRSQVSIHFINPKTGESFPAERIEVYRYRVFGFSLAGSILEKFHSKELNKKPPAGDWCCRDIPFILEARFRDRGEEITHRHEARFRITWKQKS